VDFPRTRDAKVQNLKITASPGKHKNPAIFKKKAVKFMRVAEGKTLMIVEDFYGIRRSIEKMGIAMGFEILLAADLETAKKLVLYNRKPDIALIDINLPDGNGLDFVYDNQEYFKDTRIAIVSQAVNRDTFTAGYHIGIRDFLAKPFEPKKLEELLQKFLVEKSIKDSAALAKC